MASLMDELRGIIAGIAEIDDASTILPEADLYRDLGIDSMQALEIVMEIEQRWGVKVPEKRLREIRSLADAVRVAEELGAVAS